MYNIFWRSLDILYILNPIFWHLLLLLLLLCNIPKLYLQHLYNHQPKLNCAYKIFLIKNYYILWLCNLNLFPYIRKGLKIDGKMDSCMLWKLKKIVKSKCIAPFKSYFWCLSTYLGILFCVNSKDGLKMF